MSSNSSTSRSPLSFLYENKNELVALLYIKYYHRQNVTELAHHMDRSKSNAHAYAEQLRVRELIEEVDKNDLTEQRYLSKRGPKKVYQLSHQGNQIFDIYLSQFFTRDQIDRLQQQISVDNETYIQQLIQSLIQPPKQQQFFDPVMRSYFFSVINEVMEKLAFQEYLIRIQQFQQEIGQEMPKLMQDNQRQEAIATITRIIENNPALILNELLEIPIFSFDDTRELTQIIINFFSQIFDYIDARKGKLNPKGSQYMYFFSGFVNTGLFSKFNPDR